MLDWSAMKKVLIKSQLVNTRKDIINIYATGELKYDLNSFWNIVIMFVMMPLLLSGQETHLQGLSLKEVAASLDLSESATAGLLHRGRQSLIHRMGKWDE